MVKKTVLMPLLAVLVLLAMIAAMAGLFDRRIAPGLADRPSAPPPDNLLTVSSHTVAVAEPVPASVEAKQATLISARIMAGITQILVRSGDTVTQGQLLLNLEKTDLQARAKQAHQQVKAFEARVKEAQLELARAEQLAQQKLIAAAALDQARANHDAITAQLASARQALEEAQTAVGFTEIRSPINGRVVDRFAEPGDTAVPGGKLLSIYDPLSLRIEAQVREQLALALQVGQPLQVEIPALGKQLAAEVEEIVPAANPGSRSFLVKARIAFNQDLLPGMYARLNIPAGERQQLLIPRDRVASIGQLDVVWVLEAGTLQRRFVRTGQTTADGQIEIIAGLNSGDQLGAVNAP